MRWNFKPTRLKNEWSKIKTKWQQQPIRLKNGLKWGSITLVIVGLLSTLLFLQKTNTNSITTYKATPFPLKIASQFPKIPTPSDNPITVEGVDLGRKLFYDPILSGDSTQSKTPWKCTDLGIWP